MSAPKKVNLKNKRRPADRDSSDADADEPEVEAPPPKKAKANKEGKTGKKSADKAAVQESEAPSKAKKEAKAGKKAGGKAPPQENVDKEALTEQALKVIEEGISAPDAQKGGRAFIPKDWHIQYSPHLGKYRKFLNRHPERFVTVDTDNGNFVVKRASEAAAKELGNVGRKPWVKALETAWKAYCMAVPKEQRDLKEFVAEIPGQKPAGQKKERPAGSPRSSPKAAPTSSPKNAPAAEPATDKVKKKLKKKKAAA